MMAQAAARATSERREAELLAAQELVKSTFDAKGFSILREGDLTGPGARPPAHS